MQHQAGGLFESLPLVDLGCKSCTEQATHLQSTAAVSLRLDGTQERMVMQIRILDIMALLMGFVAAVRPAAIQLHPLRPPRSLCILKNYVLVCETMLIACAAVFGCTRLLVSQPWFTGGTSQVNHVGLPCAFASMPSHALR